MELRELKDGEQNCSTCFWSLPENKDPERPEICKSPNDDLYILEGYRCWEPIILGVEQ